VVQAISVQAGSGKTVSGGCFQPVTMNRLSKLQPAWGGGHQHAKTRNILNQSHCSRAGGITGKTAEKPALFHPKYCGMVCIIDKYFPHRSFQDTVNAKIHPRHILECPGKDESVGGSQGKLNHTGSLYINVQLNIIRGAVILYNEV